MSADASLISFARTIIEGDRAAVLAQLEAAPQLATVGIAIGASRHGPEGYYVDEIGHYLYRGDTALHVAAAAYAADIACDLITAGAIVGAVNRRGAQPLHYAVDGAPGSARWNPAAQAQTVACLVRLGADANAVDRNGTSPLHRATRNRCAAAASALLRVGADPHATNGSGSTALQLARWTTGRGGSGSAEARAQQDEIVRALTAASGV